MKKLQRRNDEIKIRISSYERIRKERKRRKQDGLIKPRKNRV